MNRHIHDKETGRSGIRVSFELFPPKTPEGLLRLDREVDRLAALEPEYFSVTYGAGGTTRGRTRDAVERVAGRTGLPVAHHLTCVGASRAGIDALARKLRDSGIRRIVALRGDAPGGGPYRPSADGYPFAVDLVEGLMRVADFDIAVAAYPEVHPEAASPEADIDNLKRKFDAGARFAITQYAFDTDAVLRFIDRARTARIGALIVPGIMPVSHFGGLKRFSARCGASIPGWIERIFEGLDERPRARASVAAAVVIEQCRRLAAEGLADFHICTMSLRLGDDAPDFTAETTDGEVSFHDYLGDGWGVLFSHPADFTPVCTTELAAAARLKGEFEKRNCRIIGLSVDPLGRHREWAGDIEETQGQAVNFPIIADHDRKVSTLYDMIHPNAAETVTVRSVFFIGPDRKVKATIAYPPSTGRNFDEILRTLDSLQLTAAHKVATPVNWRHGDDVIILPALTDEQAKELFPDGWDEQKPYLRVVPQPGR